MQMQTLINMNGENHTFESVTAAHRFALHMAASTSRNGEIVLTHPEAGMRTTLVFQDGKLKSGKVNLL